jgi:proteasome alpha subunit
MLGRDPSAAANTPPRQLTSDQLEIAVLDRLRPRRAFRRLGGPLLERLLAEDDPTTGVPHTDDRRAGLHDTLTGLNGGEPEPPAPTPVAGDPVSERPDQESGHPQEPAGGRPDGDEGDGEGGTGGQGSGDE